MPKYNISLKDNKFFPFIKITTFEAYPRILVTRKVVEDGSLYYGPYPNQNSLKYLLKIVRKIFTFCNCQNRPESCLYYHLKLCPLPEHQINRQNYRKIIKQIILFLEGKHQVIFNKLNREMKLQSRNLNYEKAAQIKKQIDLLNIALKENINPHDYENNPNLLEDLALKEMEDLKSLLHLKKIPAKIEGYDISNIQGVHATGSLVVFISGISEKSSYRKFKIKLTSRPNDIGMLEEVIRRRFKHPKWSYPDLIVVDGGKNQVQAIQKVLLELNIGIFVIGLAKKIEVIYTFDDKEVKLPKSSPTLQLLMRIRDEAHRFAHQYYEKVHSSNLFSE